MMLFVNERICKDLSLSPFRWRFKKKKTCGRYAILTKPFFCHIEIFKHKYRKKYVNGSEYSPNDTKQDIEAKCCWI